MAIKSFSQPKPQPELWAALDLGSNSFHLLLVQVNDGRIRVLERLKEKVQLLAGEEHGVIRQEAFVRGLECIQRFQQRLSDVPREHIQVMGTQALRQANNAGGFAEDVGEIMGVPLTVIPGEQEATLISRAIKEGVGARATTQLVVDIGGGSTEIAVNQSCRVMAPVSLALGCVAMKDAHFGAGQSQGYAEAKAQALAVLQTTDFSGAIVNQDMDSDMEVVGTSGTVESVLTVLRANGWSWDTITAEGMEHLEQAIVDERWIVDAGMPGLAPDRVDIFPAGVAILKACFEVLSIQQMHYVDVSLLHGMILSQIETPAESTQDHAIGRPIMRTTIANQSIAQLADRFQIDAEQARRVIRTALQIFDQCGDWWADERSARQWLTWAAELHELGMHVNARHYHRHGAYIVRHADVAGLDDHEKSIVALLIRGHRRSLPRLAFQAYAPDLAEELTRMAAILRIAVILERSHSDSESPEVSVVLTEQGLELTVGNQWLKSHPLSANELEVEADQLAGAGIELVIA